MQQAGRAGIDEDQPHQNRQGAAHDKETQRLRAQAPQTTLPSMRSQARDDGSHDQGHDEHLQGIQKHLANKVIQGQRGQTP